VESDVVVLRARVGHLTITTAPPEADVTIDDQAVGRTPFDKPLLVSIGRRKVIASLPGRPPVARYVDVAAADDLSISLQLASSDSPTAAPLEPQPVGLPQTETHAGPGGEGASLRVVGWVVTGAAAAGAITVGVLAMQASSSLATARDAYPTSAGTLSHDASLVTTYSIIADSLTAAAVIVGGVTLYSSLSSASSMSSKRGSVGGARVSVGPGSARFEMTF
jgi:hypothetical protein